MFAAFGGHAMAAGLSISPDKVDEFRKKINDECTLTEDDLAVKRYVDAKMDLGRATLKMYNEIIKLEPFGTGNIKPLIECDDLVIKNIYEFGNGRFTTLKVSLNGNDYNVKIFKPNSEIIAYINERDGGDMKERLKANEEIKIDILYSLSFSDYNGPHVEIHPEEYR
jgi:single-stranded-DNA-specific exonuclease